MNRTKIIRMIVGLCCLAGGIGFFIQETMVPGFILAAAGGAMIAAAFKGKNKE